MHRLYPKIITLLTLACGLYLMATPAMANNGWPAISLNSAIIISPSSNQQANFEQGFKSVLIKVSGNPAIMTLPTIRSASDHIAQMIQSYHIVTKAAPTPNSPAQTAVIINYNPKAIAHLLTLAGQPMWDAQRPTTLVWLSINQANGPATVVDATENNTQPVAVALEQVAQNRGLSLLFPEMDLDDQTLAQSNNADGLLSSDAMQHLANRYHVQSVLAGSLTQVDHQWQAQWRYLLDSAPITWEQSLTSAQNIADNALNTVASTMVAQLALSTDTGEHTQLYLHITGITDLTTYAAIDQCLSHLPHMTQLTPVDLNEQSVTLLASYDGSVAMLRQTLTQSCHLAFDNIMPAPTKTIPSQQTQKAELATMLLHFNGSPS